MGGLVLCSRLRLALWVHSLFYLIVAIAQMPLTLSELLCWGKGNRTGMVRDTTSFGNLVLLHFSAFLAGWRHFSVTNVGGKYRFHVNRIQ